MMNLYHSLLDNEEDLIKSSDRAVNPFHVLDVKKIYILGPDEPVNTDIPNMMEFLSFFDWNEIKKDNLNINFNDFPGPIYNGFTREYREKINIISYILCKFLINSKYNQSKYTPISYEIETKIKKYILPKYRKFKIDFYKDFDLHRHKTVDQLKLIFKGRAINNIQGLQIIFNK